MTSDDYIRRVGIAADQGDLNAIADLVKQGADGSRILSNDEVAALERGIRALARRHRRGGIIAFVGFVLLVLGLSVLNG